MPASYSPSEELPDDDYPLVFTTGRQLEHWHTGSMTRRSRVLDALQPEAVVCLHSDDLQRMAIDDGDMVRLESRRGELSARARRDDGVYPGSVFMAFCYYEAAANLLTSSTLDPVSRIPGFKYCAVRLSRAD